MLLTAIVRRFDQLMSKAENDVRQTFLESLAVAQVEAPGDEASRGGLRFRGTAQAATGIAPVQALPTTAAQWFLYNPVNNRVSAWVDTLGCELTSGTAATTGTELYFTMAGPANVPATIQIASKSGVVIQNANPISAKGASALSLNSGVTLQGTNTWFPIAASYPFGTGAPVGQCACVTRNIDGKIIIPPGCGLGLAVISGTGTTPLFAPFAEWREYLADLE
jgi:hypothetical protein